MSKASLRLSQESVPNHTDKKVDFAQFLSNIDLNCYPMEREKKFKETDYPVLLQNMCFWNLFRHKIVSVYLVMTSEQFRFIYYYYWEMSFWKKFSSA